MIDRTGEDVMSMLSVPSISNEYYLSSTPLNESLIAMDSIIKKFKNDYHTDKVALVTLTDGSANHHFY